MSNERSWTHTTVVGWWAGSGGAQRVAAWTEGDRNCPKGCPGYKVRGCGCQSFAKIAIIASSGNGSDARGRVFGGIDARRKCNAVCGSHADV